jgi:hypothetical protein
VLYVTLALLVGLPLVSVMRRVLLLPPLFEPLAHGLLVLVGVVAVLAAWRDPEAVGRAGGAGEEGGDSRDGAGEQPPRAPGQASGRGAPQ